MNSVPIRYNLNTAYHVIETINVNIKILKDIKVVNYSFPIKVPENDPIHIQVNTLLFKDADSIKCNVSGTTSFGETFLSCTDDIKNMDEFVDYDEECNYRVCQFCQHLMIQYPECVKKIDQIIL